MTSYWMVIGSYFVAADHGNKTRPEVLRLAIDRLLRARPDHADSFSGHRWSALSKGFADLTVPRGATS